MPGHQHAVRCQGAHGVWGHGSVAQADDEGGAVGGEQFLQLAAHRPDRPLEEVCLPLPEGGQVDGEIAAGGLPQGLGALFAQNVHPGQGVSLQLRFRGLHAGQP